MTKYVLGIESSCDDTSVAIVAQDGTVKAIKTVSQYEVHQAFGGIYPELASRAHLEAILPTIEQVMSEAEVTPNDLAAIGVTRGPGLIGSLLIGLSTAEALSMGWDVPVYGINHLRGHMRSVDLEDARTQYPAVVMLVSGGHTLVAELKDPWSYRLLGTTRDDSVGESYDKVARMLGLGMPGGPAIDAAAKRGTPILRLPRR
jgi:N6-L-threonylcarbamoyladenine synthase